MHIYKKKPAAFKYLDVDYHGNSRSSEAFGSALYLILQTHTETLWSTLLEVKLSFMSSWLQLQENLSFIVQQQMMWSCLVFQ